MSVSWLSHIRMVRLRNEHRIISLKYCVWYRSHSWHTILLLWRWFDCKFYPKTCFCIYVCPRISLGCDSKCVWRMMTEPSLPIACNISFPLFKPLHKNTQEAEKVKDYLHFVNNINISIVIWPIYFIFWYFESIIYLFTLLFICFLFLHWLLWISDGVYKKNAYYLYYY